MAGIRRHLCLVLLLLGGASTAARTAPRLTAVTPVRSGDLLGCLLRTSDLPGPRIMSSIESGLTSSIEIEIEVVDARRRRVAGRRLFVELSFDLWDEFFTASLDGAVERFSSRDSLDSWLRQPPFLHIAPMDEFDHILPPLQVRAGLTLHPIATRDRERVENVIVGAGPGSVDRHEATFGFGRLIRFFYRHDDASSQAMTGSAPFTLEELFHEDD